MSYNFLIIEFLYYILKSCSNIENEAIFFLAGTFSNIHTLWYRKYEILLLRNRYLLLKYVCPYIHELTTGIILLSY